MIWSLLLSVLLIFYCTSKHFTGIVKHVSKYVRNTKLWWLDPLVLWPWKFEYSGTFKKRQATKKQKQKQKTKNKKIKLKKIKLKAYILNNSFSTVAIFQWFDHDLTKKKICAVFSSSNFPLDCIDVLNLKQFLCPTEGHTRTKGHKKFREKCLIVRRRYSPVHHSVDYDAPIPIHCYNAFSAR